MTETGRRPFRWAILGTGAVSRKFVLDLRELKGRAEAHTVVSRDPKNAERFSKALGVAHVVADYEAAAQADVDALYIATPPALHEAHALMGIAAGKAILIEKPLALDAAGARRIADAADAASVFCMEAMWTRFQPLLSKIHTQIEAGALGELRGFEARFMTANKPDPDTGLFDAERGGGALMHRGVYPLSIAHFLLGPVARMRAMAEIGATGVDEDSALVLHHKNGAVSSLRASLRANGPEGAVVYGTKGTLHIHGPIWRPTGATLATTYPASATTGGARKFEAFRESGLGLRLSRGLGRLKTAAGRGQVRVVAPFAGNGYHYEAEAVMDALADGRTLDPRMPMSESVEIMALIDTARAGWSTGEGL
ncbi:MAG: Gfo/Idh/MocA family oxidoreductase [Pseudomonadota bacterium]